MAPLSVIVWPPSINTLAPAATLSEAPVPIVTEARVELPPPRAIEPLVMSRVARSSRLAIIGSAVDWV